MNSESKSNAQIDATMNDKEFIETDREISLLIRAKYPLIYVISHEERRVLMQLEQIRADIVKHRKSKLEGQLQRETDPKMSATLKQALDTVTSAHQILMWSTTSGLLHWNAYKERPTQDEKKETPPEMVHAPRPLRLNGCEDTRDPNKLLPFLVRNRRKTLDGIDMRSALFVFCDLQSWLDRDDPRGRFSHMVVRALRDLVQRLRYGPDVSSVILLSPYEAIPRELNKDIEVIDYPLPTEQQLAARFSAQKENMQRTYGPECIKLTEKEEAALIRALSGLTYDEADNVLAKSLANDAHITKDDIKEALAEKRQIIQKDGTLEYFDSEIKLSQVGGLERLIRWLKQRRSAFIGHRVELPENKFIELPRPKGLLMIGVPGGGKSLVSKAVATAWELPLLRLDIGRIFGGIVGKSEENMRRAQRIAESIAPAVLWLDEVEKAFPKQTSSTDSGTSLRVMNTFLTWMQEKKAPVFVVATGNDISKLPPELTRKGRFDEIFYVGLPDEKARRRIFEIHTENLPISVDGINKMAEQCKHYTGAEIEQLVKNASYLLASLLEEHSDWDIEDVVLEALQSAAKNFVPLAKRRGPDGRTLLANMYDAARTLAVRASDSFEEPPRDSAEGGDVEELDEERRW